MRNLWEKMRDFINRKGVGYWLTRSELISGLGRASESTLDTYRGLLTKAGYLRKRGRGLYIVIEEIPYMTLSDLKNEGDDLNLGRPKGYITWDNTNQYYYHTQDTSNSTKQPKKKGFLSEKDFKL